MSQYLEPVIGVVDQLEKMLKLCIGFVVLGTVFGNKHVIEQTHGDKSPEPFYELPCLATGGICVAANDCPDGKLSNTRGLCPVQQRSGVECCFGIPKSETRCRWNGGECRPQTVRCPEELTYKRATDCEDDEKCCILVD